jgi:hypothetical protein
MEGAMWQARTALLRQRKPGSKAKFSDEEQLPRRWSELILRLNDLEHSKEQEATTQGTVLSARSSS